MSTRDGYEAIFVSNPDASGVMRLTDPSRTPKYANYPKWSPDGSRIAVEGYSQIDSSGTIADKRLWIMNADGSGAYKVSDQPLRHASLLWASDGSKIFFLSDNDAAFTVRPDGTGLTSVPGWPVGFSPTSWSPDGTRLLAFTNTASVYQIWALDTDGSNRVRLSNSGDSHAQWSPDGSKIVFGSNRSGQGEIWVMDADSSNPRQLTTTPNGEVSIYPRWSPDGRQIVFSSSRSGWDLWVMNADGSSPTDITHALGGSTQWSSWGAYPVVPPTPTPTPTISPTATTTPINLLCAPLPSGSVSWWPSEGNTQDILNARNGTATGSVTFTAGEVGQALHFDGTSGSISVPGAFGGGPEVMIEAWVRTTATSRDFEANGFDGHPGLPSQLCIL